MAKASDYDLLLEIQRAVNRLEDKVDRRMSLMEDRVNVLETFRDNLVGKLTLLTGILSVSFTMVWDWIKSKLNK